MNNNNISTSPVSSSTNPEFVTKPIDGSQGGAQALLTLDVDDQIINRAIDSYIAEDAVSSNDQALTKRTETNKIYNAGKQTTLKDFKSYQSRYTDNVILEVEDSNMAILMSRIPDIEVKQGNEKDEESEDTAEILTQFVNEIVGSKKNLTRLEVLSRQLPLYFAGFMKAFWNNEKNRIDFKVVPRNMMVIDTQCTTNDVQDFRFVGEYVDYTIASLIETFPEKKEQIMTQHGIQNFDLKNLSSADSAVLNTKVKILEMWFKYNVPVKKSESGDDMYEQKMCVVWRDGQLILKKMLSPYWDDTEEYEYFTMTPDGKKKERVNVEQLLAPNAEEAFLRSIKRESVKKNFFEQPEFPYLMIGQYQLGETPFDFTSRTEQSIPQQDEVDKRSRQITEMNDRAKVKHVFSAAAVDKRDLAKLDLDNPDIDLVVKGNPNLVHSQFMGGTPAPAQMYNDVQIERQKIFQKGAANDTTRGVRAGQETAQGRQILREADYGKIDFLAAKTVDVACEWQSRWSLQFIKLFYGEGRYENVRGSDGIVIRARFNSDMIADGLEVVVTSTGRDRIERRNRANDMAMIGMIDPYNYFKDNGLPDPIGRTRMLILFKLSPELYLNEVEQKANKRPLTTGESLAVKMEQAKQREIMYRFSLLQTQGDTKSASEQLAQAMQQAAAGQPIGQQQQGNPQEQPQQPEQPQAEPQPQAQQPQM